MRALALFCSLLGAFGLSACGSATDDASAAGVELVRVGGDFSSPLLVTAPRGERKRFYVVEQGGTIQVVKNGKRLGRPFLDVRDQITAGGEQGLLGLAFAPDFAKSKRFYVHYSAKGSGDTRIVEYRASSRDRADAGSARVVLRQEQPEPNHNGGQIAFGPDGFLYIGLGDGGGADDQHGARGNGQDLSTLLGKILRIDPRKSGGRGYSIPKDNPFVGRSGARGEIWSYGLRNPWRFSFDRRTGDLAIADVGQNDVEEVDFVTPEQGKGANFGWRAWEGTRQNTDESVSDHVEPVIEKSHGEGWCSITGGFVVRDEALSDLVGRYVYGDFCKGQIRSAKLRPGRASGDRPLAGVETISDLSSFGEDGRGRVYAVSLAGPVYRLAPK